jgi:hypothetical protein
MKFSAGRFQPLAGKMRVAAGTLLSHQMLTPQSLKLDPRPSLRGMRCDFATPIAKAGLVFGLMYFSPGTGRWVGDSNL